MKIRKIKGFTCACLLGYTLAFLPACSEENETPVSPEFPDNIEAITLPEPGISEEFTFNASMEWTLSSSRIWCKLASGEELVQMLAGTAGEQTVSIEVTDDVWEFEDATAELTLTMGGQSKVIATVTRSAQELDIENLDNIEIAYSNGQDGSNTSIVVKANFNWILEENNIPAWLSADKLSREGYAGRSYEINLKVKDGFQVSAQEGVITFQQKDTEATFSVPVSFSGMGPEDIETSISNPWNWTVSGNGASYWAGATAGTDTEETEKFDFPLNIKIATKNNDYVVVKLFSYNGWLYSKPNGYNVFDFFEVTDHKEGNISIEQCQPNEKDKRGGYVMAIPTEVFNNQLAEKVDNIINSNGDDINDEYVKYVLWSFTQEIEASANVGFNLTKDYIEPIACISGDGGTGYNDYLIYDLGIPANQIFYVSIPTGSSLNIDPMLSSEEWGGDLIVKDFQGTNIEVDGSWSYGVNSSESGFTVQHIMTKSLMVIFKGTDLLNKKALIIEVK